MSRFAAFTPEEREAIHDGLIGEAGIDPNEDPSFPERVRIAEALIAELEED